MVPEVAPEAAGEPVLFGQVVGQPEPSPVEEPPAPVLGVVVGEEGIITEQPSAPEGSEGGRGSVEALGRWIEKGRARGRGGRIGKAMPTKMHGDVRLAFSKFVDELVQNGASSGILAISGGSPSWCDVSWSASPDDKSYKRHGPPDGAARRRAEAKKKGKEPLKIRFADFEGVVDDLGGENQIAVYRVTLPSGGLDPDKWAGRPPPLAPEELYTGPRRDGLLSTDEISGDYCCCFFPFFWILMTVVPRGPDMIETWSTCCILPPGPMAHPGLMGVRTRDPGTNAFGGMTFSADGTTSDGFRKCPCSQTRAFHKVETRDLAGKWWGCFCFPFMPFWPPLHGFLTTKKALNEDQYEESGLCFILCLPCPVETTTHTRKYVNGHPTNAFDGYDWQGQPVTNWHRDPGCATASDQRTWCKLPY